MRISFFSPKYKTIHPQKPIVPRLKKPSYPESGLVEKEGKHEYQNEDTSSSSACLPSLQRPVKFHGISAQSKERVHRKIRAKINNSNNNNDPHLFITLLFTEHVRVG